MIASPSDVPSERQIIRDVVGEWTAIHSLDKSAVLLPVSWESHSAPEMGDRPQGIINRRLLRDCDILIAAFWTRIGSPTGHAVSGTAEEIEEHISAGKETMIYFSQAPVRPDSIDPQQYEQLKAFRQQCESRGLYESYESLSEFREKLARQLAVTMIRVTASEPQARLAREREIAAPAPESRQPPISISQTAQRLLKTASLDKNGTILHVRVMGGPIIQAGRQQLNMQDDARDTARWESALEELERLSLVKPTSYKREIFQLTSAGYELADQITLEH